jgi:hypothetical protein
MAGRRLHPQPQFFVAFIPRIPTVVINLAVGMRIVFNGPTVRFGETPTLARIGCVPGTMAACGPILACSNRWVSHDIHGIAVL